MSYKSKDIVHHNMHALNNTIGTKVSPMLLLFLERVPLLLADIPGADNPLGFLLKEYTVLLGPLT